MRRLSLTISLCGLVTACLVGGIAGEPPRPSKHAVLDALMKAEVTDSERQLVHLSHTCTLMLEGQRFPVIDVREIVPGVPSPRGVNAIVILDERLHVKRAINYVDQRPLYCAGNQLMLYGMLAVDNVGAQGNILTFHDEGQRIDVSFAEVSEWQASSTDQFEW